MKQIKRPSVQTLIRAHKRLSICAAAVILTATSGASYSMVRAQSVQDIQNKINGLQSQNDQSQNAVSKLQVQASNYQDAITKLAGQIANVSAAINVSKAEQSELQRKIDASQVRLEQQRQILGADIKAMYVEGDMSTVEMLATSKNLSEFVDAETYRGAIQAKVQTTLKEIARLQNQLEEQQNKVEVLLQDQAKQQTQLNADRAEQGRLLAMTKGQQDAYNNKIKQNNGQIAKLKQEQAAIIAALFASDGSHVVAGNNGNDTYPNKWRNASQDSVIDNWGMYNRECVSYTAWKVAESGRRMPYWGGVGNANQWDDNARAAGIPVDTVPRRGDVAVKNSGYYGHVMYVERVYDDGSIYISQYNAMLNGTYSEAYISAAAIRNSGLVFVHF